VSDMRIYDNGGRSFDRYTVIFADEGYALGIGDTGNVPNGFCMTVEAVEGPHLGNRVELDALPIPVRSAVENELRLIESHT
jgi:metal-dependent amidase/aminoacylase/carboxypeptidase family protein